MVMAHHYDLFTPGPVSLRQEVLDQLGRPMLHHRTEEFEQIWTGLGRGLQSIFRAKEPVGVLSASGTAAMEALVANLFSPGAHVLVPVSGKFSRRWAEICRAYGVEVSRIDLAAGESPAPEAVAESLARDPRAEAMLLTQCESSTGALTDVRAVVESVRDVERRSGRAILTVSDSVTSLGIDPLESDLWGLDAVVAASQKGLVGPPGLAFVWLGARARSQIGRTAQPRYYLDLRRYLDDPARPPFTPSVPLVAAIKRSVDVLIDLGLDKVWQANRAAASALRSVFQAAGLDPVARCQSGGVVAFWTGKVPADALYQALRDEHGVVVARGQGDLGGKILRASGIAKRPRDILFFAGAFASSLSRLGVRLDLGSVTREIEPTLEACRIWE